MAKYRTKDNRSNNRQKGSFFALALFAALGLFALSSPHAISATLENYASDKYHADDPYDIKISYSLGFSDSDINTLQQAECIESVSTSPGSGYTVSQSDLTKVGNQYPKLYLKVSGTSDTPALSEKYYGLVSDASAYIINNIAPSLTAAREQTVSSEVRREISSLESTAAEEEEKNKDLDEELLQLNEEYEQAMADFDSEQQSINKAKEIIRQNEKSAQSSIESEKKDLTSVLNEVYNKSVVTSSDLKRAQGLSNYVSGSEKSLHSQFTGQWAELSSIETKMHEDQVALTEEKEKREDEIAAEKAQISQNRIQTAARIDSLQTILDESSGHWILESRSSSPAYSALTSTNHDIKSRYVPFCLVVYGACLISCVLTTLNIISTNRSRISTWQQHGLEYRIIKSVFVRRSSLAAGIGALLGSVAGCILSPVLFINSSSDISGNASSYLKISWLVPLVGTIILIASAALASYASLEFQTDRATEKNTEQKETEPSVQEKKESSLKIDALQEDLLQRFGD